MSTPPPKPPPRDEFRGRLRRARDVVRVPPSYRDLARATVAEDDRDDDRHRDSAAVTTEHVVEIDLPGDANAGTSAAPSHPPRDRVPLRERFGGSAQIPANGSPSPPRSRAPEEPADTPAPEEPADTPAVATLPDTATRLVGAAVVPPQTPEHRTAPDEALVEAVQEARERAARAEGELEAVRRELARVLEERDRLTAELARRPRRRGVLRDRTS